MTRPEGRDVEEAFRAGFVAIVGLPNVGKSTLLNGLVGARLGIVSPKAQTTRRRLLGIYSDERHQAVFVDTPGLLRPRYPLQEAMLREALEAREEADALLYVVDAGFGPSIEDALGARPPPEVPAVLCLNKVDRLAGAEADALADRLAETGWDPVLPTVATEGRGVDALRAAVLERLPASPPYYPTDELATAPVRFFVAEFVRETCFERLAEEVPYSVEVEVEEFRERGEGRPTYIAARVYVERASQKGIVIGEGGRMIRDIGADARRKIEAFLGGPVYLELRVKVLPNWRRRRNLLKLLGFRTPSDGR